MEIFFQNEQVVDQLFYLTFGRKLNPLSEHQRIIEDQSKQIRIMKSGNYFKSTD